MTAERCTHYELLHRVCERKGWRVKLRSNLDGAITPSATNGIDLRITTLDVYEGAELIARADLTTLDFRAYQIPVRLVRAAETLLRGLKDAGLLDAEAA